MNISKGKYVNGKIMKVQVSVPVLVEKILPTGKKVIRRDSRTFHLRLRADGKYTGRGEGPGVFVVWGAVDKWGEPQLELPEFLSKKQPKPLPEVA